MATDVKKVKFVYFDYVHPKAFHLTSYKQNLFLTFASYIEKLPEITLKIQNKTLHCKTYATPDVDSVWKIICSAISNIKGPYAYHILIPQGSTGSSTLFDIKWKPVFV